MAVIHEDIGFLRSRETKTNFSMMHAMSFCEGSIEGIKIWLNTFSFHRKTTQDLPRFLASQMFGKLKTRLGAIKSIALTQRTLGG